MARHFCPYKTNVSLYTRHPYSQTIQLYLMNSCNKLNDNYAKANGCARISIYESAWMVSMKGDTNKIGTHYEQLHVFQYSYTYNGTQHIYDTKAYNNNNNKLKTNTNKL